MFQRVRPTDSIVLMLGMVEMLGKSVIGKNGFVLGEGKIPCFWWSGVMAHGILLKSNGKRESKIDKRVQSNSSSVPVSDEHEQPE